MDKVEAYRCEVCKGDGMLRFQTMRVIGVDENNKRITEDHEAHMDRCVKCKGSGVVWLTKEESDV